MVFILLLFAFLGLEGLCLGRGCRAEPTFSQSSLDVGVWIPLASLILMVMPECPKGAFLTRTSEVPPKEIILGHQEPSLNIQNVETLVCHRYLELEHSSYLTTQSCEVSSQGTKPYRLQLPGGNPGSTRVQQLADLVCLRLGCPAEAHSFPQPHTLPCLPCLHSTKPTAGAVWAAELPSLMVQPVET